MAANGDGGAPEATGAAEAAGSAGAGSACDPRPVIISTTFRETGTTGVHTHFQQVAQFLREHGTPVKIVTPFSWARPLTYPVFAPRLVLQRVHGTASVLWYRHWHEVFLRNALERELAAAGDCVIYAQGPLDARAALAARTGPRQRVVMAVHFRTSQADEHAEPGRELKRDGRVFRAIRETEREVIQQLDGLVYVTKWARDALLTWLPEAVWVPSTVISNFVAPLPAGEGAEAGAAAEADEYLADLVTAGRLDDRKNHRFLLEALAAACKAGHRLTLDVYGDGPLKRDLEQRIAALGLETQVRLCGFRTDVRALLPRYRAYAHAAYAETSSLAIIEAMAAGLPIIAGGIGPIAELADDGVEARFWPLDNPEQAAVIAVELLGSEEARAKAGAAALERFRRDYSAAVLGPQIRSFLLDPAGVT
jgi:glycosyltransferase involved in cell wall biosynthesis